MQIHNKYRFGQIVYLSTDIDQEQRMVTGLIVRPNSAIIYFLTAGTMETTHYEIEISETKNVF